MRIALVSSTLPPEGRGGAEAYVAQLAEALAPRHELLLLSGASDAGASSITHHRLPRLPPTTSEDSAAHKLLWHARDQWLPSVHRAVRQELTSFRPDVVHTHELQGLSAAPYTAIASTRAPHVHTAHDLNLLCVRTSMTRDGEPCGGACLECRVQRTVRSGAVRRHITHFIAVSDFIRDRHVAAGVVPAARASTVRLGVAVPPGGPRVRSVARDGGIRLGCMGTLGRHKGITTLLTAMTEAPRHWSLTIAGAGDLEGEVRAAAAADPRIGYLGHVGGASKEAFFDAIDLLVVPSEWEEPAALVCLEAAARGVPSLVSDRGGLPENPEVTVFRARDAQALLVGAARLATGERLREASERLLGRRDELAWSSHVDEVVAVFERAVAAARQ